MVDVAGYVVGKLLGQGTYGQTFEATKDGQRYALKLIKAEALRLGFDLRRFQREVRALQKVTGPHVVQIREAGATNVGKDLRYYIVMEYLEGNSLAQAFRDAGLEFDEPRLKGILTQIVSGLEAMFDQNIIHRDLKPENVFVTDAGTVKLLDFGLVKMLDYTTLTSTPGRAIGTPLYIAPEILRGDEVDFRADFYSLGVLIYHLATKGNYPFTADTPLELYAHVVDTEPVRPVKYNPALSNSFENLVLTLLAKQPYERVYGHDELKVAIETTPLTVPRALKAESRQKREACPKRCFIRLLQNEIGVVRQFVQQGVKPDGIVYQANFLPKFKKSLAELRTLGVPYALDPVTYRLAYSSFAQTKGLSELPYVLDRLSTLTPAMLQSLDAQQNYARGVIDWQTNWDCDYLTAPFHYARDLGSPWMDIDIKLIQESIACAQSLAKGKPIFAGLCFNIEAYANSDNRLALLNRYSRAKPDGYFFYVDGIDERTNNPLQIQALLGLLRLFQRMGKPVFACRVGTLGLGLLAAGVDGMSVGIASLTGFSESTLLVNRAVGYDMTTKYYIPGLLLTLPVPLAEDILRRNTTLRCQCPACSGSYKDLERVAKVHYLHVRSAEIAEMNGIADTVRRTEAFSRRVAEALARCEAIRKKQPEYLQPGHYAHLRTWQQVFKPQVV